MREQHDTRMLEQAVQAISERLAAPAQQLSEASARKSREVEAQAEATKKSADAAARGSILQAEGWKAFRILAATALVILAIGFTGRMIVSAMAPQSVVATVVSPDALPVTSFAPANTPTWPPVGAATATPQSGNNVVTTNYTLFRYIPVDLGSKKMQVAAGHQYKKETDRTFSFAWCYTDVVSDGIDIKINLGTKAPGESPVMLNLSKVVSAKSGISQDNFRKLFASCPWIDGNPDLSAPASNQAAFLFDSEVNNASVDALVTALAHGATRIELASPGGSVSEGIRAYEAIQKAGATTVATGDCASACTFLFLGGSERSVHGGRIGVHQWHTEAGVSSEEDAQYTSATLLSLFAAAGVSEQFYIAGAATTPNEIYWLTPEDLNTWHVVTAPQANG